MDEIGKVVRYVESLGWRISVDAKGYRRFYTQAGDYVVRYPATPSNPSRRLMEVIVALRRHGVPWPPPSKTELRARRER